MQHVDVPLSKEAKGHDRGPESLDEVVLSI
jgi:hypothetical protein